MRLRHGVSGIGIVVLILIGAGMASAAVQWQPTLDAAQALAAQTNRLVLIHFWGNGCPPCARMDSEVFSRPDVAETISRNYAAVKVNKAQFPNIAAQYGVNAVPTDVIVTPQGRVIGTYVGAVSAGQFMGRLEQIAGIYRGPSAGGFAQQAAVPGGVSSEYPPPDAAQPPMPAAQPPSAPAYVAGGPPGYGGAAVYTAPQPTQPIAAPAAAPYSGQYNPSLAPPAPYSAGPAIAQPPVYGASPNLNPPAAAGYGTSPGPAQPPAAAGSSYPADPAMSSRSPVGGGQFSPPATTRPLASGVPVETPGWNADRTPPGPASGAGSAVQPSGAVRGNQPEGMPPLALDGFCPVRLAEEWRWVPGNPVWGAFHEGRTYLFAGPQEQQAFLRDPNRYAPVLSGQDVVSLVEQGREMPGTRNFGARWNDRVYLFNSQENYEKFRVNPTLYESNISRNPVASTRPNYGTSMTARAPWMPGDRPY